MKIIQKDKGFTLIELVVTVAVMAIIASMAAPAYTSMMLNQNLNKSARELALVLSDARAKATLERREVKVALNSTDINTKNQLNWKPAGKATLKTGSQTQITFLPTGLAKNVNAVNFEICSEASGSISKIVTVSRMGNIEIMKEGTC